MLPLFTALPTYFVAEINIIFANHAFMKLPTLKKIFARDYFFI